MDKLLEILIEVPIFLAAALDVHRSGLGMCCRANRGYQFGSISGRVGELGAARHGMRPVWFACD